MVLNLKKLIRLISKWIRFDLNRIELTYLLNESIFLNSKPLIRIESNKWILTHIATRSIRVWLGCGGLVGLAMGWDEMGFTNPSSIPYMQMRWKNVSIPSLYFFWDKNMFQSYPKRDEIMRDPIPIEKIFILNR